MLAKSATVKKPTPFVSDLGVLVRAIRDARGWTQAELAIRADMRGERISDVEIGKNVRVEQFDKIAKAFGFRSTLEMFMSGGDDLTAKLLRLWKRIPDQEARMDVLRSMRDQIAADAERDAT